MPHDRSRSIANLLLREGSLRRDDPEHLKLYEEIFGDDVLFTELRDRLDAVGYELVQTQSKDLGLRLSVKVLAEGISKNREGLHAGHVRLLVYLWVHLVYRSILNNRHELDKAPLGREQGALFPEEGDEAPREWMPLSQLMTDFGESSSRSVIKGYLSKLQRLRYIHVDRRRDRIEVRPSLWIRFDGHRMEEFVLDLARRLGHDAPADAVRQVILGSKPATRSEGGQDA